MQTAQTDNELSSRTHKQTNAQIETPTAKRVWRASVCVCFSCWVVGVIDLPAVCLLFVPCIPGNCLSRQHAQFAEVKELEETASLKKYAYICIDLRISLTGSAGVAKFGM